MSEPGVVASVVMPLLRHTDPLPHGPQRIVVAGVTGVGKSTLCGRIAQLWNLPHVGMDELHWGPDWTPRPEFTAEATALAESDRWVTEWQYWSRGFKHGLGDRADTCIWLDFPRWRAWPRLFRRTVSRSVSGREVFEGCVEPPLWRVFTDEDHILRWESRTHNTWRERMQTIPGEFPHLTIVELRSPAEVRRWLAGPAARAVTT